MYQEELVKPMCEELTTIGFQEIKTADDVDKVMSDNEGRIPEQIATELKNVFDSFCV